MNDFEAVFLLDAIDVGIVVSGKVFHETSTCSAKCCIL